MVDAILLALADGRLVAPLGGFLVGVFLSLSPVSLPGLAASVATFGPGRLTEDGVRVRVPMRRALPVLLAFVAGMDGVLAVVGYAFVEVTVAFTRASVALHLVAAGLLGVVGLRLVLRRASLCSRARAIPPRPDQAFLFGVFFSATGCPGCGPIVIGLGSVAALLAGPGAALLVLVAFVLGRTAALAAAVAVGSRLLPAGGAEVKWGRLDVLAGALFLAAAGYYLYRVLSGDVTTLLPGEPGSGVLPG